MKVLYVNLTITSYVHPLLEKLTESGCEIVMLLPENKDGTVGSNVKQADRQGSYSIRYSRSKQMWYGKAALVDLKRIIREEQPDILMIGWPYFLSLFFDRSIMKTIRENNIRLIIREIPFQVPPFKKLSYYAEYPVYNENRILLSHKLSFKLRALLTMYIRRYIYRRADAAASYATHAFDILPSYGIDPSNIFVTYNSSDTDALFASREKVMHTPPMLEVKKRILHIGRLVKWKRVDLLIEAFYRIAESFPDSELVIIGDGPEKEALKLQANAYGLNGRVVFTGAIYDADLLGQYMYESSIYVLAGMGGLSINDAMCYSLPVVCSVCDGTEKDLVTEGLNGRFFKENDVDSLVDVLTSLLSNDRLRKQMGDASYMRIKEEINLDTVAKRYVDMFNKVLERN